MYILIRIQSRTRFPAPSFHWRFVMDGGPVALSIERLRKVYPAPRGASMPSEVVALQDLTLDVHAGELFGVLGPNGAGKTTAISILTTRARPTSGAARVAGHD